VRQAYQQANRKELAVRIPGRDELLTHLPDLRSPARAALLGLLGLTAFTAATLAMIAVDRPWPAWTLAGQLAVIALSALLLAQFFRRKDELLARHGASAYRRAFVTYAIPAASMIWAAIFHTAYMPGERVARGRIGVAVAVAGIYLLITGAMLFARVLSTFGMDNLAMVYVYTPAGGRLVDSAIYGLIRHPAYSAACRLGLTLGLWRGTWSSIAFGLLMPLGLTIWLKAVEEPDLIRRFGTSYESYRARVPAFVPRLRDVGRFWKFLVRGT
jgi:protein-S-isoprenylcysteine O-methyltransferase Ste14